MKPALKPELTIDLIAPEGNVYAMIAKAYWFLGQLGLQKQANELAERFNQFSDGNTYEDAKRLVEDYCQVTWLHTPEEVQAMNEEWERLGMEE